MKKQPELTAQTRENLFEAFWSLYCEKKIERITVQEITAKAGYHRSTFYEYFVDIYDVLNQLEASLLEYIKDNVLKGLQGDQADVTQRLANLYDVKGNYLSVLLGKDGDPNFANKIKTAMRPALIEAFGLSENEVYTAYIFEFALSAIIAILTYWYQSGKSIPSNELLSLVHAMLMRGVLPMVSKDTTVR